MIEYFLADRKVGGFISAMTYSATTYSAFMMVGLVGLTYSSGIGSLGFEMTYLAATVILMVIFAPRYWAAGRIFRLVTPSELLARRYRSPMAGAVSAISVCHARPLRIVPAHGDRIPAGGPFGRRPPLHGGMLNAAVVSFVFSWWARSEIVALTDALQAVVMLVASLLLRVSHLVAFPRGLPKPSDHDRTF
jgi:SSS family solute:Na+ symporter